MTLDASWPMAADRFGDIPQSRAFEEFGREDFGCAPESQASTLPRNAAPAPYALYRFGLLAMLQIGLSPAGELRCQEVWLLLELRNFIPLRMPAKIIRRVTILRRGESPTPIKCHNGCINTLLAAMGAPMSFPCVKNKNHDEAGGIDDMDDMSY